MRKVTVLLGVLVLLAVVAPPHTLVRAIKRLRINPMVEIVGTVASLSPTVTTGDLLRSLRASPTDLAKLVRRVHRRRSSVVAVSTAAVTRWNKDDPESWQRVRVWLTARAVRIIEV